MMHLHSVHSQRGAALIISLLLLLIVSLIGVSAVQSNITQERMISNMADQTRAFQAAEAALIDGNDWIATRPIEPVADSTGSENVSTLGQFQPVGFNWTGKGTEYGARTGAAALPDLASQPRWFIEQEGAVWDDLSTARRQGRGRYYYRISARATGTNSATQSVLQATTVRRYR